MKLYQMTFDRRDHTFEYSKFFEYLEQYDHLHVTDHSVWIVSEKTPTELMNDIIGEGMFANEFPNVDHFYISEITPDIDGYLPSSCWDWLKDKMWE